MATTNFEVNGVIDTSDTVLNNINKIATSAGAFVTWDPSAGQWSVIPNTTGTSVKSFDNSNIIGSLNVSGSGITELYNSVLIEFPHKDMRDTRDTIEFEIPAADRYPQELDNRLEISLDCMNDPVQAQYIAARELKQSRVDKIVEFRTDYTSNGLSAGDLIDITSPMYGYTSKMFRIITIDEDDSDGTILYSIQALEYDPDVYNTDGLIRKERSKKTEITPRVNNPIIEQSEGEASIGNMLAGLLTTAGINALLSLVQVGPDGAPNNQAALTLIQSETIGVSPAETESLFSLGSEVALGPSTSILLQFIVHRPVRNMMIDFEGPQGTTTYTVDGVQKNITAGIPCQLTLSGQNYITGATTLPSTIRYMEWSSYVTNFSVSVDGPTVFNLIISTLNTYDLNASNNYVTIDDVSNVIPNGRGDGMTINITNFLE